MGPNGLDGAGVGREYSVTTCVTPRPDTEFMDGMTARVLRMADYPRRSRDAVVERWSSAFGELDGDDSHAKPTAIRSIEPRRALTAREVAHRQRMLSHLARTR